jgi:predicted AAA+ superfamily ATPase
MIRKEDLKKIMREQYEVLPPDLDFIIRNTYQTIDISVPQAIIIMGVRRSGKSTFLRQLMYKENSFCFLGFEDLRLSGFETGDFEKLEEAFREEFGKKDIFCFDEIQNIPGWEIFIREKLDKRKHIVLTGSNARLLSRDLGTHLTGRHLDYEMFPFSYPEFLDFTNQLPAQATFSEYLSAGGFPEYLQNRKKEYLQNLLGDILIRDIAVRYSIRNVRVLKEMAVYLLSNIGKEFSYHSLRRIFELGSTSTVIEYISFFEESYLMFTIPRFDYSLKKQSVNPKKVYAIDNGLAIANSLSFSSDTGRMFENMVFISLRRKFKEIYYYRGSKECDFVIREGGAVISVIQVCYQLNTENRNREIDGILEAMQFFGLNEGLILTLNEEDELKKNDQIVYLKPAWSWLLTF